MLLEEAGRLSAEDLETRRKADPRGGRPRRGGTRADERDLDRTQRSAHLNRSLWIGFDGLGGGSGRVAGSKEDLLLLTTVLLSLAAPQPAEPGACGGDGTCSDLPGRTLGHSGRDLRDHGARMFDALIQLARMAQAAGTVPDSHGGVPQVMVTMDHDDLKDRVGEATTTLGEDLDPTTARRMACDADVIAGVLGADGSVLDVGRTQRLVTAAIWVALVVRDQHCACPGCRRPPVYVPRPPRRALDRGRRNQPGEPGPAVRDSPPHRPRHALGACGSARPTAGRSSERRAVTPGSGTVAARSPGGLSEERPTNDPRHQRPAA